MQPLAGALVDLDLGFVRHHTHKIVLRKTLPVIAQETDTQGIILQGSVARGDAHAGADLDIAVLLEDGHQTNFQSEVVDGILVERHSFDFETGCEKIRSNPMLAYGLAEGKILYDPSSSLTAMAEVAASILQDYHTPQEDADGIAYWLKSVRYKVAASVEASDSLRASFIICTSSWEILRSLWAVNNKPIPPCGAVMAHLNDLTTRPDRLDQLLQSLSMGDTAARISAGLAIIDWVLPHLNGIASSPQAGIQGFGR